MTISLRTNLFRFDPDELPSVMQYRASRDFLNGWQLLANHFGKPYLPTESLEEILSYLSGGPVWVNAQLLKNQQTPVIVALNPIEPDKLNRAINVWAQHILRKAAPGQQDFIDLLVPEGPAPLYAADVMHDPRQSVVAYKVVPWMLAQQLSSEPMESSVPLNLSVCSDGSLLAWDNPLFYERGDRRAVAMHSVSTGLLLLHKVPSQYASVTVHLSHILSEWRHTTHATWIKTERGISKFQIRTLRTDEGQFQTVYTSPAAELIQHMGEGHLPALGGDEVSLAGPVRPIHAHTPIGSPIGSGVGTVILDQASFHVQKTVTSAKPMLTRYVGRLIGQRDRTPQEPARPIRIAVVTAHTDVMMRINKAYENLESASPVFKEKPKPEVLLQQIQCKDAQRVLTTKTSSADIQSWFSHELLPRLSALAPDAAIIETTPEVATKDDDDPKHVLRALCAKHGISTQFIFHLPPQGDGVPSKGIAAGLKGRLRKAKMEESDPPEDYPAINGLIDAIRGTGFVPLPLERTAGIPVGTTVVSIYVDYLSRLNVFLPVITRTLVSTREMQVYVDGHGGQPGQWKTYSEGLCAIHASPKLLDGDAAKLMIRQALLAPTTVADSPLIVYINAGAKRLYPGMNDGAGDGLPPVPKSAWLIRTRSDYQTAQMTGVHSLSPLAPMYIGNRIGVHQAEHQDLVYYFTSYSKTFNKVRSHRYHTRYDVSQAQLKDSWQQLGVTEFVMIQEGNFANKDQVALQAGYWCKNAPLWDGYLRLPSPLHAARQIAEDHPVAEKLRKGRF
ncbi:RNaseH domain-containing protein [Pseudomonas sp. NPDC089408]|uniref:RNaseH domain-containing protein n=1 Tax=Pseudomonas sp. NPDC089408 TaxID=3364465 RepID=UPI00380046E7